MKKTLDDIRREWAKRPVEGPDPHEVEKKFPDRQFLWADFRECIVPGCHAPGLRGEARCREHHLEWIEGEKKKNEDREKELAKKQKSKQWNEEQAMAKVRSTNTTCSNCGVFLRFGERHVVLKEKNKIPKILQTLEQKYRVVCEYCLG